MNRRRLLATLAGAVLTPDGLWWPGRKTISIPKYLYVGDARGGARAGTGTQTMITGPFITNWYTIRALDILAKNMDRVIIFDYDTSRTADISQPRK